MKQHFRLLSLVVSLFFLFSFCLVSSGAKNQFNHRNVANDEAVASDPSQVRLMLNNDFEDGSLGAWYDDSFGNVFWGVENVTASFEVNNPAPPPVAGSNYVRAIRNAALDSGSIFLWSRPFTASPGDTVAFSFWIRSYRPSANNLELLMVIGRNETLLIGLSQLSTVNNNRWRTVDPIPIPVDSPTTIQLMFYGFCGYYEEDAIAIDDIVVVNSDGGINTTSTPTTTRATTTASTATTTRTTTMTTTTTIQTTTVSAGCGGQFGGLNGSFYSPNYPNDVYENNLDCRYLIRVDPGKIVHLTNVSYYTQYSYDFIEVYDGPSTSDWRLQRWSGGPSSGQEFRSSSTEVLVRFTSDNTNGISNYYGFSAEYVAENSFPGCGGNLGGNSGIITSPGYPSTYTNLLNCAYKIQVASGSRIRLDFTFFDTKTNYDFVEVYDGWTPTSTLILKATGPALPNPVQSSSYQMLVRFTTTVYNFNDKHQGFSANYTAI